MRDSNGSSSSQGLAFGSLTRASIANMRSRMKSMGDREISARKQVGDAESMINEEPASNVSGRGSEWLD